jgi:hypothetical protein
MPFTRHEVLVTTIFLDEREEFIYFTINTNADQLMKVSRDISYLHCFRDLERDDIITFHLQSDSY